MENKIGQGRSDLIWSGLVYSVRMRLDFLILDKYSKDYLADRRIKEVDYEQKQVGRFQIVQY